MSILLSVAACRLAELCAIALCFFCQFTVLKLCSVVSVLSESQVYFMKKVREPIPREGNVKNYILYGDVSYSPIDQLSAFIEEVC